MQKRNGQGGRKKEKEKGEISIAIAKKYSCYYGPDTQVKNMMYRNSIHPLKALGCRFLVLSPFYR